MERGQETDTYTSSMLQFAAISSVCQSYGHLHLIEAGNFLPKALEALFEAKQKVKVCDAQLFS